MQRGQRGRLAILQRCAACDLSGLLTFVRPCPGGHYSQTVRLFVHYYCDSFSKKMEIGKVLWFDPRKHFAFPVMLFDLTKKRL